MIPCICTRGVMLTGPNNRCPVCAGAGKVTAEQIGHAIDKVGGANVPAKISEFASSFFQKLSKRLGK